MVVYGHNNHHEQDSGGWPIPYIRQEQTFGIDTISTGVLTAMRFPDKKVHQSRRFL
jgi:hypothetical protein